MFNLRARVAAAVALNAAAGCSTLLVFAVAALAADAPSEQAARQDARLNSVCFIDQGCGWAVGDRGVIWHTTDGGAHWKLQTSGVDAQLESVQFLDHKTGWAAGGWTVPYTRTSKAVVLQTRDGGEHWYHDPKLLPAQLRAIKFFDAARGWAIGVGSSLFPSGVLMTDDGGRTWAALPPLGDQTWLAGDFIDPERGAVAGPRRTVSSIRHKAFAEARTPTADLGAWHRMRLDQGGNGWLVGDGGAVLATKDCGRAWNAPPGELPPGCAESFDFFALAARDDHCWIAGSPGSRVLHSADGGATWTAYPTGQSLPIRDLMFADDEHGWAVGDLGLILSTQDGGRSWQRQAGAATRSALLAIYGDPSEVPFELLAHLSGEEGYLAAVEIVNRQDVEVRSGADQMPALVHEAVLAAGGSAAETAWRFPMRPTALNLKAEEVIEGWNRCNAGQGAERLQQHLVETIRTWRPDVVFTSSPSARDNRARLINQLVLAAVARAADPATYPDQIAQAGLEPWQVRKVYCDLPAGEQGGLSLNTSQVAGRMGRLLAEIASPARGLLAAEYIPAPATVNFRLLVDHVPQQLGQRDFFSGIALDAGGEARRALTEAPKEGIERLQRSAQTRRNLQAILARADKAGQNDARWLGEVGDLTQTMDESSAAEVLFQLAQRHYRSGRWDRAADSFSLLADRYPHDPLADAALTWLVQYYASGEAAWRAQVQQRVTVSQVSALEPVDNKPLVRPAGDAVPATLSRQSGLVKNRRGQAPDGGADRAGRAAAFARVLEKSQPGLFADPTIGFPLATAERRGELPREVERFYLGVRRTRSHDAWWACAQGEQWLADRRGNPAKSVCRCDRTDASPTLDGKLDEAMWQQATPLELQSVQRDDAAWPAVALLAYDDEFLYIGVSCHQCPGLAYTDSSAPRPRDADLAAHDRVEICLDIDRDWTTYYRLVVDHRGWTCDECWHDKTWNPEWFVAAHAADDVWSVEMAIPFDALAPAAPARKEAWSLGIQRIVPAAGFQSWSRPAAVEMMSEGFGYLIFE